MASTVWKGRIVFGMVSIPVRLQKAARRERVRFHHVYRPAEQTSFEPEESETEEEMTPPPAQRPRFQTVAEKRLAGEEDEPLTFPRRQAESEFTAPEAPPIARVHHVPAGEAAGAPLLKGYEIEKDRYVVLTPSEIAALRPRTSSELSILEFVLLQEIDPLYFDTSYYVLPERGGEKPYAILFEALRQSGYVALGTVAMHGREHAVVIRPATRGLVIHTLYYDNEVRSSEEFRSDSTLAGKKELELAKMLVEALAAKFEPEKLKDTFEERLKALIETRAATAVSSEPSPTERKPAPVIDILEALRKSLEKARKPVQSEAGEKPAKAVSRRRAKAR